MLPLPLLLVAVVGERACGRLAITSPADVAAAVGCTTAEVRKANQNRFSILKLQTHFGFMRMVGPGTQVHPPRHVDCDCISSRCNVPAVSTASQNWWLTFSFIFICLLFFPNPESKSLELIWHQDYPLNLVNGELDALEIIREDLVLLAVTQSTIEHVSLRGKRQVTVSEREAY